MRTMLAITWLNLKAIGGRLGSSLVIVVGIAFVVGVLVWMLSISRGFERTLAGTGSDSRALILSAGVLAELSSTIGAEMLPLARQLPGIARDAQGRPITSAEILVITELRRGEGKQRANVNVALRGVEPAGLAMRPEVRLIEGRLFRSGLNELIVGRQAREQFQGIALGGQMEFRGSSWTIVGVFESGGDAHESELWTDYDTARNAFGRPVPSSLLVQLESPAALATVKDALSTDPRFQLDAQSERSYFAAQSDTFVQTIGIVTSVVAAIMGIGALFGALNTMYSAVSTRQVEIATLRAIGFSGAPVVASVLAEALVLALSGGVLGAALAYLAFNGMTVSTLGQGFTQVAFSFAVTPELIAQGLGWAVAIGLVGGLFPALRAARLPVVDALRGQ